MTKLWTDADQLAAESAMRHPCQCGHYFLRHAGGGCWEIVRIEGRRRYCPCDGYAEKE